jgi:hypothetical protein
MVRTEHNIHLEDTVSTTVQLDPHKSNNYGKSLIAENNFKRQKKWCEDHKS